MNKIDDFANNMKRAFLASTNQVEIQNSAQEVFDAFLADLSVTLDLDGNPRFGDKIQASDALMEVRHRLKQLDHLLPAEAAVRSNIVSQIESAIKKIDPKRLDHG